MALLSSALGPLRGPCPCCKVMATVVMDKVSTVAERTQKEEKIILKKSRVVTSLEIRDTTHGCLVCGTR